MQFVMEHLGLPARNPLALKDWYVKVLGAKLVFSDGQTPPAFFVQFPGGMVLEIYQANSSRAETSDNSLAGWRHVAFQVESIPAARPLLERRGVTFTEGVRPA